MAQIKIVYFSIIEATESTEKKPEQDKHEQNLHYSSIIWR